MKKTKTLLMLMLMVLAIGCVQKTAEEKIEELGKEKMKALEQDDFSGIKKMVVGMLRYPESYKPISTDMEIVSNKMLIYDSRSFVALRNLHYAINHFNKKYGGNDSIPDSALAELNEIHTLGKLVQCKINELNDRPLQYEGIDVYLQFYAKDYYKNKVKTGYHFVVHEDDKITLLCNHDDFLHVQTLIKQWFDYTSYSELYPDSLDIYLFRKLERIQFQDSALKAENKPVKEVIHDMLDRMEKAKQ